MNTDNPYFRLTSKSTPVKTRILILFSILSSWLSAQCIESIPYTEDFEGTGWIVPTTDPSPGSLATCWSRSSSDDLYWRPDVGQTGITFTGPSSDHTTGSGRYLHVESNFTTNTLTQTSLISPWVDLGSATTPQLRFYKHMFGVNITSLAIQIQVYGASSWSTLATISGAVQTATSDPWNETVQSLSSFTTDTVRIRFVATRNSTFGQRCHISIDDVYIGESLTCTAPNSFNVQSRTQTSVTLGWVSVGTAATQIRYVKSGDPISSATIVNVTGSSPTTISGLAPSTEYIFWVRDSCTAGTFSAWVGPLHTNTICGLISAPWSEGFEGSAFQSATTFGQPGSIHPCWVRSPSTTEGYMWVPAPLPFPNFSTGPTTGHNSSKWAQCDRVLSTSIANASLRSPHIDLTPLTNPELRYWYYMYGANINKLEVEINTGTGGWQLIRTITGQQQFNNTQQWKEDVISLSSYAGQTVFIRFKAYNNGSIFQAAIAIDDVSIDEAPPCPRPNPFSNVSVTSNSATFNFTSGGTSPWQIEYGVPGFMPGSGTLVNVTTNPATVNGLTPNTAYEFYMRDTCGVLGVSTWTGPVSARTLCTSVSAPWSEDFDGTSFAPGAFNVQGTFDPCWSASPATNTYYWTPSPPPFNNLLSGPSSDASGVGKYVYTDGGFLATINDTALLNTPAIDLSPLTVPEFTFWFHMYGAQIGGLKVEANSGSGWSTVWSISGQQQSSKSEPWKEAVVDLSSYAGSTIQIRFVGKRSSVNGDDVRIAVDELDIHEQPPCPRPLNVGFTGRTQTSINLSWTTAASSTYTIEYGFPGFTLGTGTQISGVTSSPHNITGLTPGTMYEFYVIKDCGAQGVSQPSAAKLIATLCGPIPVPYVQTFDSPVWTPPGVWPDVGDVATCWVRSDTTSIVWVAGSGAITPNNTGPNADHTTGSGQYMYLRLFTSANTLSTLRTPEFDLTPLDTPQLRFSYHMYGSDIDRLAVEVKEGSNPWTQVWRRNGQQHSNEAAPWAEAVVDLANYAGKNIFIRFVGARLSSGFTRCQVAIDDINIDEKPQCPAPTGLTATAVSETAVQLSWTSIGSSAMVEYGPVGFAPGSGTTVSAPNNPFVVSGLSANASYEFYVRDSCANGGVSWAAGPVISTTFPCANACLYELTLSSQFTNGWSAGGVNNFHNLIVTVNGNSTPYTLETGASITYMIPLCDSIPYSLSFQNNGFLSLRCGILFKDPAGNTLYSRMWGISELSSGLLYSDTGSCASVCADPVGLTVSNITPNSADVFWSSLSGNSQIAVGPSGFTPGTATQKGLSNSYGLLNLTANTTYDVYVQDTCANGMLSGWVGPFTFTTLNCALVNASFTSSVSGLSATFDGSSTSSNAATFTWDFGDGSSGSGMTDGHIYANPGIYTVTLIAANPCGDLDSVSFDIIVCGTPAAASTTLSNGLTVTMDGNLSTGLGLQYDWDNGDGTFGAGAMNVHTYATAGTYNGMLWVTDTCGNTDTVNFSFTICSLPVLGFTTSNSGTTVTFDASVSTGVTSYIWDFGDGNSGTGVNPTHTYALSQNYNVTLMGVNACGDTVSITNSVALCGPPIAKWTYQIISSGGSGMLVQFDGTASVGSTYEWDFGDGGTASGTNFPTHTYSTPGLFYWVQLIVGNACGQTDTMRYKLSQIGVEEVSASEFTLYPNPNSGVFTVVLPADYPEDVSLSLLQIDGRVLMESVEYESSDKDEVLIQVSVPPGAYLLRIQSQANVFYQRLIIE